MIASLEAIAAFASSSFFRRYSEKTKREERDMSVMVIVAYRPRPGKEALLLELMKEHLPTLQGQGLATERRSYLMRSADGTIIEVFEWKSKAAIEAAHTNPVVLKMWERYAEACEYVPLNTVKECTDMFAGFEPIETS
jgi:quinol monooxygenase YgiN